MSYFQPRTSTLQLKWVLNTEKENFCIFLLENELTYFWTPKNFGDYREVSYH